MKRSKIRPKNLFSQRIVIKIKSRNIMRDRLVSGTHLLKPSAIMMTQGFAHREAYQTRAIALFVVPLIAELIELRFSDEREPASKAFAILERT